MIIMALVTCSIAVSHAQDTEAFVRELMEEYPQARLLDIYKSCFQDFMGAEHLVSDTASVEAYLEQELSLTDGETLLPWYFEPCGVNGNYIRVSLRAVKDGYLSAESLLDAFIASANSESRPTVEEWAREWHRIIDVIDQMGLSIPHYDQDKQFIEDVLEQGKYAISHSPEYRENYSPHYRIVRRDIFEQELKPLMPQS